MYTTIAFHSGDIKEGHRHLQTHTFKTGYAVEEKGLHMHELSEVVRLQNSRFAKDVTLLRIDILDLSGKVITLIRQ